MPEQDSPIERVAGPHEEKRKVSVLIPLDDNEALQALANYKRRPQPSLRLHDSRP